MAKCCGAGSKFRPSDKAGKNPAKFREEKSKLPAKLAAYLDKAGIKHNVLAHKTVYTAYDAAQTMKKKLNEIAKSLLVKADKDYYVAILPADQKLDMEKLKKVIGKAAKKEVKVLKIPGEKIMNEVIKAKNSALTAFGGLHDLPVVAERSLEKARKLVFSSGNSNHSVEMRLKDFLKLEKAMLGKFGAKKKVKVAKK